jgi:hypothetical protein
MTAAAELARVALNLWRFHYKTETLFLDRKQLLSTDDNPLLEQQWSSPLEDSK